METRRSQGGKRRCRRCNRRRWLPLYGSCYQRRTPLPVSKRAVSPSSLIHLLVTHLNRRVQTYRLHVVRIDIQEIPGNAIATFKSLSETCWQLPLYIVSLEGGLCRSLLLFRWFTAPTIFPRHYHELETANSRQSQYRSQHHLRESAISPLFSS